MEKKYNNKSIIILMVLLNIPITISSLNSSHKKDFFENNQEKDFICTTDKNLEKTKNTETNSEANEKQPNGIQIIGTWYDRVTSNCSFSYKLYKSNGKVYLNFANIKTIQCTPYRIKGKEFTFRDDIHGIYTLAPGTFVYVGERFSEAVDINLQPYQSNIVLLIQDEILFVYTNDNDRLIYDKCCAATNRP